MSVFREPGCMQPVTVHVTMQAPRHTSLIQAALLTMACFWTESVLAAWEKCFVCCLGLPEIEKLATTCRSVHKMIAMHDSIRPDARSGFACFLSSSHPRCVVDRLRRSAFRRLLAAQAARAKEHSRLYSTVARIASKLHKARSAGWLVCPYFREALDDAEHHFCHAPESDEDVIDMALADATEPHRTSAERGADAGHHV